MDAVLFAPRELRTLPGRASGAVVTRQDASLPAQGYRIEASEDGVVITHSDDLGLRYATQAWQEWVDADGGCVEMADHPDILRRGYMLDVSRGRVPTRAYLAQLVTLLSRLRYTQLELYVEHTVAYVGHEAAWRDASPLTADDLHWLDDLCAASGIELVPNQNSLGHFDEWLRHPEYADRAENPEGRVIGEEKLGATTLAPTEDNLAFVQDLLTQQTAMIRAHRVNVGLDEPWEFGTGVSKAQCDAEGEGVVYATWAADVARPWCERGYRVEMWADILGQHPDEASLLPEGVEPIVWAYESPDCIRAVEPDAGADAGFATHAAPLRQRGHRVWTAPGTATWNTLTGRLTNAVGNIADAAAFADLGILLTTWGDHGHIEPPALTWPAIVAGGLIGWNRAFAADMQDTGRLTEAVSRVVFGVPSHPGAEFLVRVGLADDLLDRVVPNQTIVWRALVFGDSLETIDPARLDAFTAELTALDGLAAGLDPAPWVEDVRAILALTLLTVDTRRTGGDVHVPASLAHRLMRARLTSSRYGGMPRIWAVLPVEGPCPTPEDLGDIPETPYATGTTLV